MSKVKNDEMKMKEKQLENIQMNFLREICSPTKWSIGLTGDSVIARKHIAHEQITQLHDEVHQLRKTLINMKDELGEIPRELELECPITCELQLINLNKLL